MSGAWWIAPEISSNTYFDVDVDKYLKKKFNDKSTMVRGGSSLVEITFVGREFNCKKEIPDPDATILATDPVLAEVGGNSRGQLGQKRKLQE